MDAETPKFILNKMTAQAFEEADGDVVAATNLLCQKILADDGVYHYLMDPLLKNAAYNLITGVCRRERRHIWLTPNYDKGGMGDRVSALAKSNVLMNFRLNGGKRLGDATKDEVLDAADFWRKQGTDMMFKARWLSLVAEMMPARKRVKNVLTEAELQKLRDKAKNG